MRRYTATLMTVPVKDRYKKTGSKPGFFIGLISG